MCANSEDDAIDYGKRVIITRDDKGEKHCEYRR